MLVKRNRDCGTFTMYCGGLPKPDGGSRGLPVPMACANACYYINTFKPGFSTTYSSTTDNPKNRKQSGCQKAAGSSLGTSVCNIAPFSQKFHDPLEDYSTDPTYNCDEFPMAEMQQDDFDPQDVPRNTLACIDGAQNSAAGNQLRNFISGEGWYGQDEQKNGGRSDQCAGRLRDGDTYRVIFDYEGDGAFDKSTMPFCTDDGGNLLKPADPTDAEREFYLTNLGSATGTIDGSYNLVADNRYADGRTRSDVQQCSVVVERTGNSKFQIDIVYGNGMQASSGPNINLPNNNDGYTVQPPAGIRYESSKVVRTKGIGSGDGTPLEFFYGLGNADRYFAWPSDFVGADNTLNTNRPGDVPSDFKGRYCVWTPVQTVDNEKRQSITCWFPCNGPA